MTDKKWVTMGTMLLDGAGGYSLDSGTNRAWVYRVNNVTKNDFSSTEGISVYRIADGDLVEFWYGTKGGAYENALAVIRARVHVRQQTTVFDGNVTLANGTFGAFAYNSNATWPVGNLTVHGALEAAAAKGGFTYRATDKKWSTMGTFLLDGVSTFDYNKTENTAWAYTLNGVAMNDYSADQGISVQPVKNGDQLVFYFGVKGAGLDNATAVVRIRVFVANDADFSLALKGARNATVAKAGLRRLVRPRRLHRHLGHLVGDPALDPSSGMVDDGDAASFNDALATLGYTVRVSAVDGYNKSLNSSDVARSANYIIADRLNGAPLPETMWPLRLVGASVPPHLSVAKVAEIELVDLPVAPPVGGDVGYFLVSTTPAGAEVYLEDISTTRYHVGNTTAGPLNVSIYLTATPMRKIIANLSGYEDAVFTITQYPAKGETIPVDLTLDARPERHADAARHDAVQAALGPRPDRGRGLRRRRVLGHDAGQRRRRLPNDDVDIETTAGESTPNVGWVRTGEWLSYTANVTTAGNYTLSARVASPYAGRTAVLSVDGTPAATVAVPNTGSYAAFRTVQVPVALTAGTHVLKLTFSGDGQNINWIEFALCRRRRPRRARRRSSRSRSPGGSRPRTTTSAGTRTRRRVTPAAPTGRTTSISRPWPPRVRPRSAGSGPASGSPTPRPSRPTARTRSRPGSRARTRAGLRSSRSTAFRRGRLPCRTPADGPGSRP